MARFQSLATNHLVQIWIGLLLVSFIISCGSTFLSNTITRQTVVNPLLRGVITLFTISLTITTMGIQLASNRYSHRLDSSALQIQPVALHFSPHLLAILFGIFILSLGRFNSILFSLFIFSSVAAILSIFPFLLWLLESLTPSEVLRTSINQIDDNYLRQVETIVDDEKDKHFDSSGPNVNDIYEEVIYSQTTENDPVDAVSDIIRSSITEEDTGTAKRVLNEYIDRLEPTINSRYQEFKTSHSDSQLVCWYVYAPLGDIFRYALKHDNQIIVIEIITLLQESIISWHEKRRDVPEVFFRLFGRITIDYATECDPRLMQTIASDYTSIARIIAEDIDSPHTRINGATKLNFRDYCLSFAIESIDQGEYTSARVIASGLQSIIDAQLRVPSDNPKRNLLSLGLIGEKFATEDAKSKHIVEIADEVSVLDEAEFAIMTLVTFLDKIEEFQNNYSYKSKHREFVVKEIDRINDALESRNRDIAAKISDDNSLVVDVIRASRFFRSSFTPKELLEEIDTQVDVQEVADICKSLAEADVMESSGGNKYVVAVTEPLTQ